MALDQHPFSMVPTTYPWPNGGVMDSSYPSLILLSGLELVGCGGRPLACGKILAKRKLVIFWFFFPPRRSFNFFVWFGGRLLIYYFWFFTSKINILLLRKEESYYLYLKFWYGGTTAGVYELTIYDTGIGWMVECFSLAAVVFIFSFSFSLFFLVPLLRWKLENLGSKPFNPLKNHILSKTRASTCWCTFLVSFLLDLHLPPTQEQPWLLSLHCSRRLEGRENYFTFLGLNVVDLNCFLSPVL